MQSIESRIMLIRLHVMQVSLLSSTPCLLMELFPFRDVFRAQLSKPKFADCQDGFQVSRHTHGGMVLQAVIYTLRTKILTLFAAFGILLGKPRICTCQKAPAPFEMAPKLVQEPHHHGHSQPPLKPLKANLDHRRLSRNASLAPY